jgi:putative transferase (TIGR04331 family)
VPQVTLEFQQGKFSERLAQCRLHICDNCSTTIAESLWANHPTLILITEDYFQLCPDAAEEYDALARASVFHTSQASLLAHIKRLEGGGLEAWWLAARTQEAIQHFLDGQGRTGSRLKHWKQALLQVYAVA